MSLDVIDLRDFYTTSLGQVAARAIRRKVRGVWPDVKGESILGLGFATPYLGPFRRNGTRVLAAMPAGQGVLHWPAEGGGLATLVDEADLPFPDLSVDRVLLVHGLEMTEQVPALMREVWRVMTGSGRLLVVVPNRRGIWARFERTPFGHGRTYSMGQLSRLLRDTMFTPVQSQTALFVPPTRSRMVLASARAWEELGTRGFNTFAGVVMIEATKQIYAGHALPDRRRRLANLPLPQRPCAAQGFGPIERSRRLEKSRS